MIDASLIKTYTFRSDEQIVSFKYTIPSINAGGTSDTVRCAIADANEGKLVGFNVSCGSEDFDISLRTAETVVTPSLNEILNILGIFQRKDTTKLSRYYANEDSEDYMYLVLTNNDAVNNTGVVSFELLLSKM